MIHGITVLLGCQLAGEVIARAAGLSLPGPVLGMALLLVLLVTIPKLAEVVRAVAQGLLAHLSLLFVPAGVGIVGHLDRLGSDGAAILAAILVSTGLAITVGVLVFRGVARLAGVPDE